MMNNLLAPRVLESATTVTTPLHFVPRLLEEETN